MAVRHGAYEELLDILDEADEPLTAREIVEAVDSEEFESAHRVATVLGRRAEEGEVDVIRDRPYRYHV